MAELQRLANIFANAAHPLAIPGGSASGLSNGLEAVQAVLALNTVAGNLGKMGGLFLSPTSPVHSEFPWLPNSLVDMNDLDWADEKGGGESTVHPWHQPGLRAASFCWDLQMRLASVPQVISFASFPDETSTSSGLYIPRPHRT